MRLLWRVLTNRVFEAVRTLVEAIDYGGWNRLTATTPSLKVSVRSAPVQTDWWSVVKPLLWYQLPPLLTELYPRAGPTMQMVYLGVFGLHGLPAMFAVLLIVLSVFVGVLTSVSLLPCGWSFPLAGPYLQVTAEPSPPGTWTVTQFEGGRGEGGLKHSRAYQSPEVWAFAAKWIDERRTRRDAAAQSVEPASLPAPPPGPAPGPASGSAAST